MKGSFLLLVVSIVFFCIVGGCIYLFKIGGNQAYKIIGTVGEGNAFLYVVIVVLALISSIGLYIILGEKPD
ncbi:MAG: hypothetical protein ACI35O_13530 [Bacillaceae bacterium]